MAKDESGLTALHWAAIGGQPDCISALISHGADPNVKDGYGYTPVVYATRHSDALRVLLKAGGDPNVADAYGVTPLMRAARNVRSEALQILIESGADVQATGGHGQTALLCAAWSGRIDAVRDLLTAGADVNARDSTGRTVLDALTELEPFSGRIPYLPDSADGLQQRLPPNLRRCEKRSGRQVAPNLRGLP